MNGNLEHWPCYALSVQTLNDFHAKNEKIIVDSTKLTLSILLFLFSYFR